MADNQGNDSCYGVQVETELTNSGEKIETTRLYPAPFGSYEAQLWKFTAVDTSGRRPPIKRVVAKSLDQALNYIRRMHEGFEIEKAEYKGLIPVLSGLLLRESRSE